MKMQGINTSNRRIRPSPLQIFGLFALFAAAAAGTALAGDGPDLSHWSCRYCSEAGMTRGHFEIGAQTADAAMVHAQAYSGREREEGFVLAHINWLHTDAQGRHLLIEADERGQDRRQFGLRTGTTGHWKLSLDYRNIPSLLDDAARSPFTAGNSPLRLPAHWQRAGSTPEMTRLNTLPTPRSLGQERQQWRTSMSLTQSRHWQLTLQLRRDQQHGDRVIGGSFVSKAALLPHTFTWTTDELELRADHLRPGWQTRIAYLGSRFQADAASISWQNPYTAVREGVDEGRLAQAPNNDWHRLVLSQHWQALPRLRLGWQLRAAEARQDQPFVPATENPRINVSQPRPSLQGRQSTRGGKLKLDYAPHPRLRIKAHLKLDDRDNRTPVSRWKPVLTDVEELTPRANTPYSFRHEQARISAQLRSSGHWQLNAGAQTDQRRRTLQQFESTHTDSAWIELATRRGSGSGLSVKLSLSAREAEQQSLRGNATRAPENPGMRQYHLADREQRKLQFRWQSMPFGGLHGSLQLGLTQDDYSASLIGLQSGMQWQSSIQLSWSPQPLDMSISSFFSLQGINAELLNSASQARPDWRGTSRDTAMAYGVDLSVPQLWGKLGGRLQFLGSASAGKVTVDAGAAQAGFPALRADMQQLDIELDYPLRENLRLRMGYQLERYRTENWANEDVARDSISNVLGMGTGPGDQHTNLISLSLRYVL